MPHINPEKVATYIREVAADKILPRWQQLAKHEISTKSGPTDLVTVADLEAEKDLTHIFKDIIPGSYVLGEEAVSKKETDIGLLGSEEGYVWVIDPVDGTLNFAEGRERFGTIVALAHKGEIIQGWILDIPQDRMAVGEKGSGVQLNGKRTTYPTMNKSLHDTRGFISRKFLPPKMREELKPVIEAEFGNVETYLCCAHEYLDILAGQAHFSMYSRIRPWDHQAGAMMMREAGGYVRKWDGSEYRAGDQRGGIICTPNENVWSEIYGRLLADYIKAA
ncbi:MAG TPA: inositol monophosphatase [Alphaproteobacteria bacterium]|nr:inositol monophosphatase [Alphaproteobacteria bacterium]